MPRPAIGRATRSGLNRYLQRDLKLRHLRLLLALDEYRQVGKVANALSISQPAVSKTLAQIEAGLGLQLFVRTPRGLEPTPEGICLIRHAQTMEDDIGKTLRDLDAIGQPDVWRLAVGFMHGTPALLPQVLARLKSRALQARNFDLIVHEANADSLVAMLRTRKIDIAVCVAPDHHAASDLKIVPLHAQPMAWIVARGHALAGRTGIALSELLNSLWVVPPHTTRLRAYVDAMLRRREIAHPPMVVESLSMESTLGLVCDQGAAALVSHHTARAWQGRGVVDILNVDAGRIVIPVCAITLTEAIPTSELREFMQAVLEAATE